MQVIQTVNDTIRILYNPSSEDFKLLDFLLVQDSISKYLAQIIEIYDDKYDSSQNVARIKLFYKVNDEGEVFEYDHFTPSKECEIKKMSRREILNFVNDEKTVLNIGLDYQSEEPFELNIDFLKNNPVIFADKIDKSCVISAHFANVLSRYNYTSVIFDYTGRLHVKGSKRLTITRELKLPLDYFTIDYIWEKGLRGASLETQAICNDIFKEVKKFAKNSPQGFIPYEKFIKVVEKQYKATPIVELSLLLNKLEEFQRHSIFAQKKEDFECIKKAVNENQITVIDFSLIKTRWHKEFSEFIIRELKKDTFVFLRLNNYNSDSDLINFIYHKDHGLNFVPSISYNYNKMPQVIENTNNYVLLPTLNPRRDFGAASFELAAISKDECILFGENTENFVFTIKNNKFTNNSNKGPKAIKKIKLKINSSPNYTPNSFKDKFRPSYNERYQEEDVLTEEELDFFLPPGDSRAYEGKELPEEEQTALVEDKVQKEEEKVGQKEPLIQAENVEFLQAAPEIKEENEPLAQTENTEFFEAAAEINKEEPQETVQEQKPVESEFSTQDNSLSYETPKQEPVGNLANEATYELEQKLEEKEEILEKIEEEIIEKSQVLEEIEEEIEDKTETLEDIEEEIIEQNDEIIDINKEDIIDETEEKLEPEEEEETKETSPAQEDVSLAQEEKRHFIETFEEDEIDLKSLASLNSEENLSEADNLAQQTDNQEIIPQEEPQKTKEEVQEPLAQEVNTANEQEETQEINNDKVRNIQIEQIPDEPEEETFEEENQESIQDDLDEQEAFDEGFSLESLAQQSVESAFSDVIEDTEEEEEEYTVQKDNSSALVVDDNVIIDFEKIKEEIDNGENSGLPIYSSKTKNKEKQNFKEGDTIIHDKYGQGTIVKIVEYSNRSLLQINFDEVGKRLLDPDIADIKIKE